MRVFTFNVYFENSNKWAGAIRATSSEDARKQADERFGKGTTFLRMCM
jgi:hypothetical protein